MQTAPAPPLPRNIWMMWLQGEAAAPALTRVCRTSWQQQNPGWTVRMLTEDTLRDYLDPAFCDRIQGSGLPFVKQSNLFRLALLQKHGGVWADADAFCTTPLDDWIDEAAQSGFFAFQIVPAHNWLLDPDIPTWRRLRDRRLSRIAANWFLASHKRGAMVTDFLDRHQALLLFAHEHLSTSPAPVGPFIYRYLKRNPYLASLTATQGFIKLMRWYPYFLFHHHFARLVLTDATFRDEWLNVPRISAAGTIPYRDSLEQPADEQFKLDARGAESPALKLNYRATALAIDGQQTRLGWLCANYPAVPVESRAG